MQVRRSIPKPADFDSATAMTAATGRFLNGRDFPILGKSYGAALRPILVAINHLPEAARAWLYRVGSGREGLPPEVVARASADQLYSTVVPHYPERRYPGVLIGSTPGSAAHLAAAMGMPLLPQTLLVPLRRGQVDPDDPRLDMAEARPVVEELLAVNPDLVVHQMSDPTNDRLTLAKFSYLRVKRTRLGPPYEAFLRDRVEAGGTVFVVDSRHRWPTTTVGERHFFQFGGVGGLDAEEYLAGGPLVAEFLAAQGSPRRAWPAPTPDSECPEAEWGFRAPLAEDVDRMARKLGLRVVRIGFDHADDLSAAVAELYRSWYRRLGRSADRLFVESFVLIDPYWVLRAGAVPYWVTFNTMPGVQRLADYLDGTDTYERIEANLVSNGTSTPRLAGPPEWEPIFARAQARGGLAGVDADRFPTDLAVFARYRDALRYTRPVHPLPPPCSAVEVEEFLAGSGERYGVMLS